MAYIELIKITFANTLTAFVIKIFSSPCEVQASNIIIQTAENNDQMQTHVREGHTVEDQQQQQATMDAGTEISTVRFEIHTDEHGQIINIQPAMLHEIPSRNGRPQCYLQ
jgi:hypothetical protein